MNVTELLVGKLYERWVFLSDSRRGSLWDCSVWRNRIHPRLNQLFDTFRAVPSVHCRQVSGSNSRQVALGPIGWGPDDAGKWCHSSEFNERRSWRFVDLQLFWPPRAVLLSDGAQPAVYVQIAPAIIDGIEQKTVYDQSMHVVISAAELRNTPAVRESVMAIGDEESVVAAYHSMSRIRQLNAFESSLGEDFFYRGILETELPDVRRMRAKWTQLMPTRLP